VKRYMPFVLVALLAVFAAQASADNLLVNGSFQSNDFTGWTIGTTSTGTWGQGYPIVTGWPLGGGLNAAEGEVGGGSPGNFQGGTLSQSFVSGAGAATLSFSYAAMGDGIHTNADGGDFVLVLDGTELANFDVGQITADQIISGSLSANANLTAGTHTFEIEVLRQYGQAQGNTPYQFVTEADVEGQGVPEPGSFVLFLSGALGVASVVTRKLGL